MKVLLSTYNGARWLDELLMSVRAQTFTDWTMLVRDDASDDESPQIVRRHAKDDPRIQMVDSQSAAGTRAPLGAAESFFSLLRHVGPDDTFAFCDQDDVWFRHKLEWSVEALAAIDEPVAAVATDAEIVDSALAQLDPSALSSHGFSPPGDANLIGRLLINNVAIGATMVGTGRLAELARNLHATRTVTDPVFHDWWCALVAAYAGELTILPAPTMAWRRHDHNATGDTPAGTERRADRRMAYLAWSIDSARVLVEGCPAACSAHYETVAALAKVDPKSPRPGQLGAAWRAGVRPWTAKHLAALVGTGVRNLRTG